MPYDPRMMQQMGRMGVGMLGQPSGPFERPKEWWEQPLPTRKDQPADQSADPSQVPTRPPQPPSLLDMMMSLGRLTRPQYDKAIASQGDRPRDPRDPAPASPWAWLGSMGGGYGR
jgi:hypothetical protein